MMLVFLVGMLMCVQPKLLDATREKLVAKREEQKTQVSGMNVWAVEATVKDMEAEQVEAFEHSQVRPCPFAPSRLGAPAQPAAR